jgi:hypothetical protein
MCYSGFLMGLMKVAVIRKWKCWAGIVFSLVFVVLGKVSAEPNIPNFEQRENMCAPTAAANLLYWLSEKGYPNLLRRGGSMQEVSNHLIRDLSTHCHADRATGTENSDLISGLAAYIRNCGYEPTIRYQGIEQQRAPRLVWISDRIRKSNGIVLGCNAYRYNKKTGNFYTDGSSAHAVTLVSLKNDQLVIHDPERESPQDDGRRTVKLQKINMGQLTSPNYRLPATGFYQMKGISLTKNPEDIVILEDAIAIEVSHQNLEAKNRSSQL